MLKNDFVFSWYYFSIMYIILQRNQVWIASKEKCNKKEEKRNSQKVFTSRLWAIFFQFVSWLRFKCVFQANIKHTHTHVRIEMCSFCVVDVYMFRGLPDIVLRRHSVAYLEELSTMSAKLSARVCLFLLWV